MQFVWLNIVGPEDGYELRHSMQSIKMHFDGEVKTTIIGDKPSWYEGHHIPCKVFRRPPARRQMRITKIGPFQDTHNKIQVAASHPEIDSEFVWMMDDVYLLRRTSIEDLRIPRYDPWWKPVLSRDWHRLIQATFNALAAKGKPRFQVGTHLPHVFEKEKLQQCFAEYNFSNSLLLFEILYTNHWRDGFIPYGGEWQGVTYPKFLSRLLSRPRNEAALNAQVSESHVLNYQAQVFGPLMKMWLERRFPCTTAS